MSTQISQVLLNLLNNAHDAIKELGENPKWIQIDVHKKDEKYIQLSVTDCGHGIPKQHLNKIMQPFFTTKEVGKGTGLGLSISSEIIKNHGGSLTYDAQSKHTRFVIELPMRQS